MNIKVGDWVRFYQSGIIVIGVVEYITKDKYDGKISIKTDIGAIDSDYVLEKRSNHETS